MKGYLWTMGIFFILIGVLGGDLFAFFQLFLLTTPVYWVLYLLVNAGGKAGAVEEDKTADPFSRFDAMMDKRLGVDRDPEDAREPVAGPVVNLGNLRSTAYKFRG